MSLELLNALSSLGTLLVVAAATVAAIVQLRHLRNSNHIVAINELRESTEDPEFLKAAHFVAAGLSAKLQDREFRRQIGDRSSRTEENRPLIDQTIRIGNFYEIFGSLVRSGFVDRDLALEIWFNIIIQNWAMLEPVVALLRRSSSEGTWENFEYITALAQDYSKAHPKGTYPATTRRLKITDPWLETDRGDLTATS